MVHLAYLFIKCSDSKLRDLNVIKFRAKKISGTDIYLTCVISLVTQQSGQTQCFLYLWDNNTLYPDYTAKNKLVNILANEYNKFWNSNGIPN